MTFNDIFKSSFLENMVSVSMVIAGRIKAYVVQNTTTAAITRTIRCQLLRRRYARYGWYGRYVLSLLLF